jgi:hypothetical protein
VTDYLGEVARHVVKSILVEKQSDCLTYCPIELVMMQPAFSSTVAMEAGLKAFMASFGGYFASRGATIGGVYHAATEDASAAWSYLCLAEYERQVELEEV